VSQVNSQLVTKASSTHSVCSCVSRIVGYRLETWTAAELRLALTITLTLTDTGFDC